MKATLQFNLDDPDDSMAHLRCVKSTEIALALWTIRNKIAYAVDTSDSGMIDGYEMLNEMADVLTEHDINFDSLIR